MSKFVGSVGDLSLRQVNFSIDLAITSRHFIMEGHSASPLTMSQSKISKRKGLPKRLPKEQERLLFAHEKYRDIYWGGPSQKVVFPTLNHTRTLSLYTGIQTKAGLAALDDKSYWFNHASCVRYGHSYIREFGEARSKEKVSHMTADFGAPTRESVVLEDVQEELRSAVSDTKPSPLEAEEAVHTDMNMSFGEEDDPMFLSEEEDEAGPVVDMREMERRCRLRYPDRVKRSCRLRRCSFRSQCI